MQRTWWDIGIGAALLLLVGMSVSCVLDVQGILSLEPVDGNKVNTYRCVCDCETQQGQGIRLSLDVCVPDTLNGNKPGGKDPLEKADLIADCYDRVEPTFADMVACTGLTINSNTCGCGVAA